MTYQEFLNNLPNYFAEIEARTGKKLDAKQAGALLMEIGEALKYETISFDNETGYHWGACAVPTVTSTAPNLFGECFGCA